jgi:midasin
MRAPPAPIVGEFVRFEHFWLEAGPLSRPDAEQPADADGAAAAGGGTRFVQTPTVRRHLANLARAVMMRRYPVLLQVMHPSVLMPLHLGFKVCILWQGEQHRFF